MARVGGPLLAGAEEVCDLAQHLAVPGRKRENCLAGGSQYGIASEGALVRVAGSTVVQNTFLGLTTIFGGSILSRGNNTIEDNGGGEVFTGAFAPK